MNSSLERHIIFLAKRIFNQAAREFPGAKIISPRYESQDAKIEIAPNVFLSFQAWSDDSRKPFFMIIWRGAKYLMEFDLSRVIFLRDDKLTWMLNIPTRKENRQNLSELGYRSQKIEPATVEKIFQQMKDCNGRARRTPKGYILALQERADEAISKFLNIVSNTVKSEQQRNIKRGKSTGDEDLRVIEGQIAESKILGRKRNRAIVEQRKKRDQFTCQSCRFRARVEGRHVIECHHKYPLRGEGITVIDDLVCLCPTCHRIAHRRDNPYSVEEIRKILKRAMRLRDAQQ